MQELDDPTNNPGNLGLALCHSYLKSFVPQMRAWGCPKLTFADAIQVLTTTSHGRPWLWTITYWKCMHTLHQRCSQYNVFAVL